MQRGSTGTVTYFSHLFHWGTCILHPLQDSGHWSTPRKPCRMHVFLYFIYFMGKRSVLKVPFFVHSPGDPCVSRLVLPFKRRCQVINLNKTSVTKTFSSGDQKSQLHLLPGTTWQHLKLRAKGKGASFRNLWRWLQIWIVFQRKRQVYIAGRAEVMIIKLLQFFLPQVL